jgi:hypothetical protein
MYKRQKGGFFDTACEVVDNLQGTLRMLLWFKAHPSHDLPSGVHAALLNVSSLELRLPMYIPPIQHTNILLPLTEAQSVPESKRSRARKE